MKARVTNTCDACWRYLGKIVKVDGNKHVLCPWCKVQNTFAYVWRNWLDVVPRRNDG